MALLWPEHLDWHIGEDGGHGGRLMDFSIASVTEGLLLLTFAYYL